MHLDLLTAVVFFQEYFYPKYVGEFIELIVIHML